MLFSLCLEKEIYNKVQLTLKGFELHGSTYTQIFFGSKDYNTMPSMTG